MPTITVTHAHVSPASASTDRVYEDGRYWNEAHTVEIDGVDVDSLNDAIAAAQDAATEAEAARDTLIATTNVSKTNNYSVLSGDAGTHFDNLGASGEVDFTLPTAAVGLIYTFTVLAAQILKIIAGSSTTIAVGNAVSSSAGSLQSSSVGSLITLYGVSTTKWVVKECLGSWTVA